MSLKQDIIEGLYTRQLFVDPKALNYVMSATSSRALNNSFKHILKPFNPDEVSMDRGAVLDYLMQGPTTRNQINADLFGKVEGIDFHLIKLIVHKYAEIDPEGNIKLTDMGKEFALSLEPAEEAA